MNFITILIYFLIVTWISSPPLIYGMTFAYFQRQYPTLAEEERRSDIGEACLQAMFGIIGGPLALAAVYLLSKRAKHGLKFR